MSSWDPISIRPQIFSIVVVAAIIVFCCVLYYKKSKNLKANEAPSGYCLAVEIYVSYFRNMIHEILGPKFDKMTPLFVFIFTYVLVSNIIGVFGLDNPTGSYTVTLSMALIMYFGVWIVGFKFQKLSYLKNFCLKISTKSGKQIPVFINPLEVMSNIAPLISMSFRLWGNITAGSIIITLWFYFTNWIWINVPVLGTINLLGGLTGAPIRAYFDLLSGLIQALVFTMLTMVYWNMAKGDEPQSNISVSHSPTLNANIYNK